MEAGRYLSKVDIERTRRVTRRSPHTARPGIVIGRRGAEGPERCAQSARESDRQAGQLNILRGQTPITDNSARRPEASPSSSPPRACPSGAPCAGHAVGHPVQGHPGAVLRSPGRRRDEPQRVLRAGCRCTALRANIDYTLLQARAPSTATGVKVWIYKGDMTEREFARHSRPSPARAVVEAGRSVRWSPWRSRFASNTEQQQAERRRPPGCCQTRNGGLSRAHPPSDQKFRKQHRPHRTGLSRGSRIAFGDHGIQALEPAWSPIVRSRRLGIAMTRHQARRQGVDQYLPRTAPLTKSPPRPA